MADIRYYIKIYDKTNKGFLENHTMEYYDYSAAMGTYILLKSNLTKGRRIELIVDVIGEKPTILESYTKE